MQAHTPKFHEWLAAERNAQTGESELYDDMRRFSRSSSPALLDQKAARARSLRLKAHGLFDEAMNEMKTLAESHHYRRIPRMKEQ